MFNSLEKSLFCVYDKKLQIYQNVFVATGVEAEHIFKELANDVSSSFYDRASDFDIIVIGEFDDNSCEINFERRILCPLSQFVDKKRCELQYMIRTLNYLPVGYFKMPSEMQDDIKEKIDEQVKNYASYLAQNFELSDVKKELVNN